MRRAVCHHHTYALHRVPDQLARAHGLAEALLAGGDEVGGDGVADDAVFKLKLGGVVGWAAGQGGEGEGELSG